jgi:hypothetical protein
LQDFGTAKSRNTQMLPGHSTSIGTWSARVEPYAKHQRVRRF